jgi:type II secretory pathway component PulF
MVSPDPHGKYLNLEGVRVAYRRKDDTIHITSTDPDFQTSGFHISLVRGTPTERALRALLREHGMAVAKTKLEEQLPTFVTLLRTYLRALIPPEAALLNVARDMDGPLRAALDSLVMDLGYGVPFDEALRTLIEKSDSERFKHILRVIRVSVKTGVDPEELLVGIVDN